ncbi:toll-like receptor 18 [Betta splendens]|uniref:Protein S100-A1 n=1 Tax=Betta splendens TaxID=158456 RepID=A0A6P7KR94_BETSP|nr:toll-like receptor 18 [Betta splendens]
MIWELIHVSAVLLGGLASAAPAPPPRPDEQPCRVHSSGRAADCMGRQLSSVPWRQLPSTLLRVDLSYNRLQAVNAHDFARLPQLRTLYLQFNNISHIDSDAFRSNTLLEHLNIFNNSLQEIPASALTPLQGLKELYMSNNLYQQATLAESFSRFVSLQVLSMGGPLVTGLKKNDFLPLKNISLVTFAIKCSSNLSYYEPGSLQVIRTKQMGFDMAIDQQPGALPHMLRDLANKSFTAIQFRNLFEFMYYTGKEDIFQGLEHISAYQLIFHRGKFNENLLRMALINLQIAPIKRLRLQYIDFARSPTFVDSGAGSSITHLSLESLDLWYISNPDVLRFDWRFTWFNRIKNLSIKYVYFNSVPCDAWVEMAGVRFLDVSNNRLADEFIFNQLCDYRGTMPNLHTFNLSTNELSSLKDLSLLTKEFQQLQVLDFSNNKLGSDETSQGCVWQQNITRLIAHHNRFVSTALSCLPTTVRYLDLSYCDLDQLEMTYFEKATHLNELLLSGNKIKFIPSRWESPSLWSLTLDGNSFGLISKASFRDMPRLTQLRAGNNPYHCTCELHAFIQDTASTGRVNLTDWPWNYRCYHPEDFLNTLVSKYFPSKVACDIRLVIIICVATTVAVTLLLMFFCYVFDLPWYTKATYQIIRAKYRAHKEKAAGEPGAFTFHAFISYSHSDADWVREQLLPGLENNRNPYRLCIHERDFMPGKWIIDNIIENIESSRKVIFVLSRNFVNSEWCNYELYFAQQRAMGKTFSDVILVVKEPIDPSSLPSKYCRLKKMLSTKTYLEWPQQLSQQAFFWAQLRSVLGKASMDHEERRSVRRTTSSAPCGSDGQRPEHVRPEENLTAELHNAPNQRNLLQARRRLTRGLTRRRAGPISLAFTCSQVNGPPSDAISGQLSAEAASCSSRQRPRRVGLMKMASNLQKAMLGLIAVFHSYSGKEGDKYKLSKAELKTLLHNELGNFQEASNDPLVVEKIMNDLDENHDGEVDFQEFVVLVAALTVACNEFFEDCDKSKDA